MKKPIESHEKKIEFEVFGIFSKHKHIRRIVSETPIKIASGRLPQEHREVVQLEFFSLKLHADEHFFPGLVDLGGGILRFSDMGRSST